MLRYLLSILLIPLSNAAMASSVYWGGVSFSNWDNRDNLYPNVSQFFCVNDSCSQDGDLNIWARPYLDDFTSSNFEVTSDLISGNQVEGVIMTPMISRESLNVVKDITGSNISFIHVYRIFGSMMFFEFSSGRFIASRPVVAQYTDTLPQMASDDQIRAGFRKLLDPKHGGVNLFQELFNSSSNVRPYTFSERLIRVGEVSIEDKALQALSTDDLDVWLDLIRKQVESYLVKHTGGPFVPSLSQDSATQEFSATFSNAAKVIKLPEEVAFDISINIKNLKTLEKVLRKQKTLCHAVSLNFEINGLIQKIMDVDLVRTKESCGVISVDKVVDNSYYLTQSIYSLLFEMSKSMSGDPDSEFIKRSGGKAADKNMKNFMVAWEEVFSSDF